MNKIFNINETTGEISPLIKFDREINDSFTFKVKAFQKDKPELRNTYAIIHINIIDINDNSPEILKDEYKITINEYLNEGSIILKVSAIDKDAVCNSIQFLLCK